DWRVQPASASALAEMKAQEAIAPIVRAIREPTTKAGLGDLMIALVRIDPIRGPSEILPFLTNSSGKVRETALQSLPNAMDGRYLPQVLALTTSQRGATRAA